MIMGRLVTELQVVRIIGLVQQSHYSFVQSRIDIYIKNACAFKYVVVLSDYKSN